jgi:hypothetical protein
VILGRQDRKPAENDVAVIAALMLPILTQTKIHPKPGRKKTGLMFSMTAVRMTHDLLQRYGIGVEFGNHVRDALGRIAPVDTDALVDVVRGDPDSGHQLLR